MTHVLAIDPGLRATGYAFFRGGNLASCGLIRCKLTERADIAAAIGRELALQFLRPLDAIIIEVPQVYQSRLMKGDPNDLVSIALVAGAALQVPAKVRRAVSPHQWKGNTPKDVTCRRLLMALNEQERDILADAAVPSSLRHNILDAIGIGKWFLDQQPRLRS